MSVDDGLLGPTPADAQEATGDAASELPTQGVQSPSQEVRGARLQAAAALERLEHAQADLTDAEGAISVAQARATEEAEDPDKAGWERMAVQETVRVTERVRHRAVASLVRAELEHETAEAALIAAVARESSPPPGTNAKGDTAGSDLHFVNVYVFVETFLVHVHARYYDPVGGWNWCARWWEHTEAVSRLEALWQAFEILRREPGVGPATWWRDYCDPTMAQLTDPGGPFSQCKAGESPRHQLPSQLPIEAAPGGLIAT